MCIRDRYDANCRSHDRAGQQPEQHRQLTENAAEDPREQQGESDRRQRQVDVRRRREIRRIRRAGDDTAIYLDEIDRDQQQHDADHGSGKILQAARKHRQHREIEYAGQDHGADRGLDIGLLGRGQEDDDRGAAGNHDERQPRPEFPGPVALQQRPQSADQERRADQVDGQRWWKIQRLADQKHRGDRRRGHHQHMLKTQQDQLAGRQDFIDRQNLCLHDGIPNGPRLKGLNSLQGTLKIATKA